MSDDLLQVLRERGPVSPAVQMRYLLAFGREHEWTFESAWRWSFERIRWPHDTTHRKEWKMILGDGPADPSRDPTRQREMWRSSYERAAQTASEESVGKLLLAA